MTDTPTTTPPPSVPASAPAAPHYDGFNAFIVTDMSTLVPDIATMLNALKLGIGDEMICFVRRHG